MALLYLTDIMKRAGLNPERVKLIRHALSDKGFRECYDKNLIREYTQQQKKDFSNGYDYWLVFVSDKSTLARFEGCYKVGDVFPDIEEKCPPGFPHPEWYKGEGCIYSLEETNIMAELRGRLVIEWGKGTRSWAQKGTSEKEIVAIKENQKRVFEGFENIRLKFSELKEIVEDSITYENWQTALSSVYAVYLISDLEDGELYVGSAYNKDGLLGRWSNYVSTKHGGNTLMREKLRKYPERYLKFQFSVLQILPKNLTPDEVNQIENLWKKKLLSKEFGMNDN